jgi:hypothetical protein
VTVSGAGLLTSSNGAIRCGWSPAPQTRCAEEVGPPGTRHLRAKALHPFRFSGWNGGCHGSKPRCTAYLNYNSLSITGLFRRR